MGVASRLALCFVVLILVIVPVARGEDSRGTLKGLEAAVEIHYDSYGIPHIYATSWTDAARTLGYLHATDRLWQMDMYRRQASGTTAEVIGRAGLESDILMRQLGIRRGCETLWNSDKLPSALRAEFEAYAAGVNVRLEELGDKDLPLYFQALGYKPAPWTPTDSLVFNKYMGWDQSGTNDDLWFGRMVGKLGSAAAEELWPLDRPYEEPTVVWQNNRRESPKPLTKSVSASDGFDAAFERLSRARSPFRGLHFGSNNWAVDGTKTASGKPMLCNDPHLGFQLPSIWYTAHLSVGGKNVAGVTFPGGPGVVIGHNDRIAWGITNMQADAVDYYVETLKPDDPLAYQHRGAWLRVDREHEEIPIRGEAAHPLDIDYTIHGPIISRDKQVVALCWTGLGPTNDVAGFWGIQRADNLEQFLAALDMLVVPCLNMAYADIEGNIGVHPAGALPLRTHGQGRIPLDGASGDYDWTGMIPASEMPLAVNPSEHYIASANGRPASIGYPHYLGWMWDPSYRKRRINELLAAAKGLTLEAMQTIQLDAYDKAAERFLPPLLGALSDESLDAFARRVRDETARWNFVADQGSIGTLVWLRWFSLYREQVWDDEWSSRGIEKVGGSWGFSGTNRREPMLEVLEYLTREFPQSVWFDDRRTVERENRDSIARRSFALAVESLRKEFGDDLENWRWGKINVLQIRSLSGQAELARQGGPVVGDSYTLNPGSNIGTVGGGASFRLLVDFGNPAASLGIYPGGQSENPASPHYADQMALWAAGKYAPLLPVAAAQLPEPIKANKLVLQP